MTISELSVRRPVLMTMVYLLIVVIAIVYLPRLDISLYPDIDLPVVSVIVSCGDAGPEEIEQQVARVIENSISSVENLNKMTSISQEEYCYFILEFDYGTDTDEAADDVEAALSLASWQLPDWVESTQVIQFDAVNSSTILRLTLSGPLPISELQTIADDTVSPLIERISGVSQVNAFGSANTEYDVLVYTNRAEAYGLTLTDISAAIAARNIQSTAGEITQDGIDYQIAVDERYMSIEDIENTYITTIDGYDVLIKDVADVIETTEDGGRESYYNNNQVITLAVMNDSDSSETTVAKAVIEALPSIREVLPEGVELTIQQDSTEMIQSTMSEVYNSLVQGVILAALIIFVFLRGIKTTIIISLSMPISVLITLMVMSIADMSVNIMTMSGLILGIGMIVDASIIILENTYSFRAQGEKSAIAAIMGSKNMFLSITASTLTTICVFVPFIIYKYDLEMMGVMFEDLAFTVCISLICSLFVSVTLVPALCGSILRINTRTQKPLKNKVLKAIDDKMAHFEDCLREGYAKLLDSFLSHRMVLVVFLLFLLIFSLLQFAELGISLAPPSDSDDELTIDLTLAPGTTQSVTREHLFAMQSLILDTIPEDSYESIMIEVGSSNTGSITLYLPDITEQIYTVRDIENIIRPLLGTNPEETWVVSAGRQMGNTNPIDVAIYSDDTEAASTVANSIVRIMDEYVPELIDIDNDLEDGQPEIKISIDFEKARDLGVSASTITSTLTAAITGLTATEITTFSSENTYDVVVRIADSDLDEISALKALMISSSSGSIRLESIAEFESVLAPRTITREDKVRVNHITANVVDGVSSSEAQNKLDMALDAYLVLPEGVTISQAGEMSEFSGYGPVLIMIILLALFLVYAVMAAQFESLMDPFIIFATVPLLMIGVVWVHIFYGADFTLFSFVGIIALIGVVVNNGIVLVDCINRLVRQKVPVRQACLEAARGRLRPILMTTLTTILGLIPMAFFPGEGSEMMQPIALTFVGGITTGAFMTLFLSPVLYSLLNTRREKKYDDPESLNNQLQEYDMRKLTHFDSHL